MSLQWCLAWYNLIFAVPFLLALAYLMAYAASGITFGDVDADADADAEADVDTDAEMEADADAEAEPEVEAVPPSVAALDTVAELSPRLRRRALSRLHEAAPLVVALLRFFGVGRVPLSVLLMVLFFAWGFLGFAANALARETPAIAAAPWQVSIPVALLGSALAGRAGSVVLGRWLPATESYARDRATLVGRPGAAVLRIDEHFGLAVVRDNRGNGHQIPCFVRAGESPIEKGGALVVAAYDPTTRLFHVRPPDRAE